MLRLTVWGSRGGVPVSGTRVVRHGGATTCLEIARADDDASRVVIDLGTGAVDLGRSWGARGGDTLFLQTHFHWDHVDGFPFFAPFYNPHNRFELWAVPRDAMTLRSVLAERLSGPSFPIDLEDIPAKLAFRDVVEHGEHRWQGLDIAWTEMMHPSGSTAWRLRDAASGARLVFSGDVEVQHGCAEALVEFASGADLLVMDAQYTPEEYPRYRGFGHSTVADAVEVAVRAGVPHLVMTHHDASHDDATLDAKLELARILADGRVQVSNAFDGMRLSVCPGRASDAWRSLPSPAAS